MYAPHQGAQALRVHVDSEEVTVQLTADQEGRIPIIAGSVSIRGKKLYLTMTNSHVQDAKELMDLISKLYPGCSRCFSSVC